MAYLPALWASDGDVVLVEDIPYALKAIKKVNIPYEDVLFLTKNDILGLKFSSIEPWGWNYHLKEMLINSGIDESILPVNERLSNIRELSSRKITSKLLNSLREDVKDLTIGESFFAQNYLDIESLVNQFGQVIVKALWSSSGRGIRYVSKLQGLDESLKGWIKKTIEEQDGIMVEPYYGKIMDFAMEFFSFDDGSIEFQAFSIFESENARYLGNIISSNETKLSILTKYIDKDLLDYIKQSLKECLSKLLKSRYTGPLGIDMMIVPNKMNKGFLVHPLVEMNLRMTMGHVASWIKHEPKERDLRMKIIHDVNYKLKFEPLENNFVKVI